MTRGGRLKYDKRQSGSASGACSVAGSRPYLAAYRPPLANRNNTTAAADVKRRGRPVTRQPPRTAAEMRVDMDIAIREAGRAFDRGDFDAEIRHFRRADEIQLDIYAAEWRGDGEA